MLFRSLISPASIFGDATFTGCGRESAASKHEFDAMILEETQKFVIDPAMQMLSRLGAPSGHPELPLLLL